jgi:hypothetical protein
LAIVWMHAWSCCTFTSPCVFVRMFFRYCSQPQSHGLLFRRMCKANSFTLIGRAARSRLRASITAATAKSCGDVLGRHYHCAGRPTQPIATARRIAQRSLPPPRPSSGASGLPLRVVPKPPLLQPPLMPPLLAWTTKAAATGPTNRRLMTRRMTTTQAGPARPQARLRPPRPRLGP